MLDKALARATSTLKEDYALQLQVGRAGFSGLTTVRLERVAVTPDSAPRLVDVKQMKISVKLLPLLSQKIRLDRVDLEDAFLTLVKENGAANYDFLFSRKKADVAGPSDRTQPNLAQMAEKLIEQAFDKIPYHADLKNVAVSYRDSSGTQRVHIPEGQIRRGRYDVDVFLNENSAKWNLSGKIARRDKELSITIASENPDLELPLLRRKYGLKTKFDKVTFDLKEIKRHGREQLMVLGSFEVHDLLLNNRRLSDKDINLPHAMATGGLLISENALQITDGSAVRVRDFEFSPQIKYTHQPSKRIDLSIHTGRFKAQDFFDALPRGLFETLEGIQVDGAIAYDLDFAVDFDQPDSLHFVSRIDDRELKILKWGNADISKLNGEFVHEVYEDTTKLREILVGRANPNFTPLPQIAPILVTTVLNTEDPFFYEHKGFEEEAFQLSIITNIKEKGFKRGASTISMQLVKNLYLNRNKTVMRKLEEILLVWLMERSGQVSKDRLLEIYFNIIEWGKNVYGIREASQYYFGKAPSQLTLGESLFLSSIVPRPKTGLSSFDYTGHLKPWVKRHFNTYGYIMQRRNQLQNVEVPEGYGFYQVVLQPNLRPPRPKGVIDSIPSSEQMHEMIDDIDADEARRRSLIERLLGIGREKEENESTAPQE